ncbi:MAG: hypothetical protein IPM39_11045 [Chloroflexi bacterium]|nr:hypothetical protein [Chloroflexota bacterium]
MTKTHLVWREKTIGDTAVDGLLAGLVGGGVMALFLLTAGWLTGTPPQITLAYFDPAQAGSWLTGLLAHLAVSAIYGVVFGLLLGMVGRIRPSLVRWGWLMGLGYGLLLWLLGLGVVLTAVGAPLAQISPGQFALAHLIYGLVLGFWFGKNQ